MSIFEDVKSQLNIQQVVEHYGFRVNRAKQFVCPFHNDHNPSASIKNDYFHCFVCGAGGDLITFTAKYLGISNLEAARELVREFELDIDISTAEERKAQDIRVKIKRKELKACDNASARFNKDQEIKAGIRIYNNYGIRKEINGKERKIEDELEQYIHYAELVLSSYHYYLWQGVQLYPFEHERHIKGLQELTVCQFYIDFLNHDAVKFLKKCKGVINRYERELDKVAEQRKSN